MKLDLFEAHDRLKHLRQDQAAVINQGCEDCLKKNPLSLALQEKSPYIYIFAHPRTADDGVTQKLYWQPRLEKPKAQTNSYLFRATSHTDNLEVCWLLPPRELWPQYRKGNVTESEWVTWSIYQFQYKRAELEKAFEDDFSRDRVKQIYIQIASEMDEQNKLKKLIR
jgi:hypothetical protein